MDFGARHPVTTTTAQLRRPEQAPIRWDRSGSTRRRILDVGLGMSALAVSELAVSALAVSALAVSISVSGCGQPSEQSPTPSETATPGQEATPTATTVPSNTPTPSPTPTEPPGKTLELTVQARISLAPMPGVSVWLGQEGTGTTYVTDSQGKVTVDASEPVQDISLGYVYQTGSSTLQEYRIIRTWLDYNLQENPVFTLTEPNLREEDQTLEFVVSGIEGGDDRALALLAGTSLGASSKLYALKDFSGDLAATMNYHAADFLWASEVSYVPELGGYVTYSLPVAFGVSFDPQNTSSLALDRHFDQQVGINMIAQDGNAATSFHDMELTLPAGAGTLFFSSQPYALGTAESKVLPVPSLTGALAGSSLTVRAVAVTRDERGHQVRQQAAQPGQNLTFDLPSLHQSVLSTPLNAANLAGSQVDLTGYESSDEVTLSYTDQRRSNTAAYVIRRQWSVVGSDPGRPLQVPLIPADGFDWLSDSESSGYSTTSQRALTEMRYGYTDDTPTYGMTQYYVETVSPDALEPNNTQQTAAEVPLAYESLVLNHGFGDVDWFKTTLSDDGWYSALVSGGSSASTSLRLYDSTGNVRLEDDGADGQLSLEGDLPPGTYYLKLEDTEDELFTAYQLMLDGQVYRLDPYEPNDTRETAHPISLNFLSDTAYIEPAIDQDWFEFSVDSRSDVHIEADSESGGEPLSLLLELYTVDGYYVDANYDLVGSLTELDTLLTPGTYALKVSGLGWELGSYQLSIEASFSDVDGDGYTANVDCQDDDPYTHPGAIDFCGDGLDQNCDGTLTICPEGCYFTQDSRAQMYWMCSGTQTFADAQLTCQNLGGNLAKVVSQAEEEFLTAQLFFGLQATAAWIGLSDGAVEGTYRWMDNTLPSYSAWAKGEPNNAGNEDCVELSADSGLWYDSACSSLRSVICQGPPPRDLDDDGYGFVEDCNDQNPSIHPGAEEVCEDYIDQDCTGSDVLCAETDADDDGYTPEQGDCDDFRADVHPGTVDVCGDGNDQDCYLGDATCPPCLQLDNAGTSLLNTYHLCTDSRSFDNAEKQCQVLGGHLVSITSAEEQTLMDAAATRFAVPDGIWIGLTDSEVEGSFTWLDGSSLSYTHWASGEPNSRLGDEDCGSMQETGTWNDLYCKSITPYVCEVLGVGK